MNSRLIPKKEILLDFFFRYASETDLSALERSVAAGGIRNPISILPGDGGYRILSGFRRFRAAEAVGLDPLACRVLSPGVSVERHFEEALLEQASQREFHPVEMARVHRILTGLKVPRDMMITRFFPILGLAPKSELAEEVAGLLSFHPALLEYLERHTVSLKQASAFRPFSTDDQAVLAGLGTGLQIRIVELSDMAGWLHDLSRSRGTVMEALLENAGIPDLIARQDLNRNEKIASIKEAIRRERYPTLESWNEKIRTLRAELRVPGCIRLGWDPTLEAPGFRMEIRIRSARDLAAVAAFFSSEKNRKRMGEMLALV
jgi:hypothetical protein